MSKSRYWQAFAVTPLQDDFYNLINQTNSDTGKSVWKIKENTERQFIISCGEIRLNLPADSKPGFTINGINYQYPLLEMIRLFAWRLDLPLPLIQVLSLKQQWETFFLQNLSNKINKYDNIADIYTKNRKLLVKLSAEFGQIADVDAILRNDQDKDSYSCADSTEMGRRLLVDQMLRADLHLLAIDSIETLRFVNYRIAEEKLLADAGLAEIDRYRQVRQNWLAGCADLEHYLLQIEDARLKNAAIRQNWLLVFGEGYNQLMSARYEYELLTRIIVIKEEFPALSYDEVRLAALSDMSTLEQECKKSADELQTALKIFVYNHIGNTETVRKDDLTDYKTECRKLLRRIWLLSHPDKGIATKLTKIQQDELTGYFKESIEIRDFETGFSIRSLEYLRLILSRVEKIREQAGLDYGDEFTINKSTLLEQIDYLENEIMNLCHEQTVVRNELFTLQNNKNIQEYKMCLNNQEQTEKGIKDKTDWYIQQCAVLNCRSKELFYIEQSNGIFW